MAKINIKKLYFALVTKDELDALIFATPEYIPGVKQIDGKPKSNTEKLFAEGTVWDQDTTVEEIAVDIDLAELSNAQYAKYLGHHVATNGGVYTKEGDSAPYIAILYEAEKSNHKKAYRVFYKGQLTEPDESVKGKEGKTDFQTHKVQATFQTLKNNGMGVYKIDEDDPNCPADIATTFFENVIIPDTTPTVPTVTSVPADGAPGVAASASVVFTFSEPIQYDTVDDSNIFLTAADGTLIANVLSLDVTNTIVTLNPNVDLAPGSYTAICTKNVTSAAGIPLAANVIVNFTVV